MFVLDSHCDTPLQILDSRDLAIDNRGAHVDFPKLKKGKVDGAFFALFIPALYDDDPDKAFCHAKKLLNVTRASVAANSSSAAFAVSYDQAFENKNRSIFSVFLGLENGSPIGHDLERLRWFYENGVRYVTLCHSGNNQICDSCAPIQKRWGGLSPFGRELVAEMNRIGMLIDVSHISDDSFYDVLKYSDKPVVATHSCCRALAGHPRNMTDDMIQALANAGGVMQINFYPLFLDNDFSFTGKRPSYHVIVDHIDHAVSLAGIDHVGIGSDFDGIEVTPDGLDDISMMPLIFEEMRKRGYSESDIEKVAGSNFLRVLG